MKKTIRVSLSILALALLVMSPVTVLAQEITGSVRGTITTPSGDPAVGASVTIIDSRTGSTRSVSTNEDGMFTFRGLVIGGPYSINVSAANYQETMVTDVYTNLSGAATFNIALQSQGALEEVLVVASATVAAADLAIGPSTAFDLEEIQALPTISRQIRDIVRLDPRVNVGRTAGGNGNGVSCLGGSARANSFTIDGVRTGDGFGLNASGFAARNVFPVPFDTVRSASVEFAPMDVQYGQFTGCNINIVTKGGGNEFSATAFYLMNDDSLTNDTITGDTRTITNTAEFEDTNWGVEVSGPIIKDKLFFYVSYEETDEGGVQNTGPIGAGFPNERHLTLDQANEIRNILINQYGRDPGELVRTLPEFSERTFIRIDWNINDNHRAELSYVDLLENNVEPDDLGFNGFTFSDNFELEGTDQEVYSLRLFSDWTDNFSTEVRLSSLEVQDIQGPLGGGEAQDDDKVRIVVETSPSDGTDIFTSGPGFFRSANDLRYTTDQIKLAGFYDMGDHRLTFGYEEDSLDVFNLFIPNATGTLIFDDIAALAAGDLDFAFFTGSYTQDPSDAAAAFARDIESYYIQDEWTPNDRTTITYGVRYDRYVSNDSPVYNPVFEARFGMSNTQSFDGLNLLMPRIGVTHDLEWDSWGEMQLRAGIGIFSGSDPTVHFANSYQNFGGALGDATIFSSPCTSADRDILAGGFSGLPECMRIAAQNSALQNQGGTAAIQPGFDLPSQNRFNLGMSLRTDSDANWLDDWQVEVDWIYSNHQDSIAYWDLANTPRVDENGNIIFLPDGRPQFAPIDPLLPGCNAVFQGPGVGFTGVTPECEMPRARGATGDSLQHILMGNGLEGTTSTVSIQLAKSWNIGERSSLDFRFGYAYTDAEIGNAVGSSTATSGYEEEAQAVINQSILAPSVWVNEHNLVLGATFRTYFFEDHPTQIGVFMRRRSGRPFSYTYDNPTSQNLFGDSDDEERNLFYVPTGPNDPLVDFSRLESQGTLQAFFDFLNRSGLSAYGGQISPRNGFNQQWNTDVDIRISQDIPLGDSRHSLKLFFDIENFLNLIDDDMNVMKYTANGDINEGSPIVDARLSSDGTQYIYENFRPHGTSNPEGLDFDDSAWRIQLGLRYKFN